MIFIIPILFPTLHTFSVLLSTQPVFLHLIFLALLVHGLHSDDTSIGDALSHHSCF